MDSKYKWPLIIIVIVIAVLLAYGAQKMDGKDNAATNTATGTAVSPPAAMMPTTPSTTQAPGTVDQQPAVPSTSRTDEGTVSPSAQ